MIRALKFTLVDEAVLIAEENGLADIAVAPCPIEGTCNHDRCAKLRAASRHPED